ncbi:MAG: DUF1059 domain-containing protein [Anaerolineales bacterium]|jgi:hypothetical protein
MTKELTGQELGVTDCDFVVRGETVSDIVEGMVDHLRKKHNIQMPDAKVIVKGEAEDYFPEMDDKAAGLIVRRMIEKLEIVPSPDTPEPPKPAIGKLTP